MSKLLIICFIGLFSLHGCAQTRTGIQRTWAFFRESFPGNIPVDDNGNPLKGMDTLRFIYIEYAGTVEPVIEIVQYRNKIYSTAVHAADQRPLVVGKRKGSTQNIVIKPGKGNKIWRVELNPSGEVASRKTTKIIMKGKKDGRFFTRIIEKEIELESEVNY